MILRDEVDERGLFTLQFVPRPEPRKKRASPALRKKAKSRRRTSPTPRYVAPDSNRPHGTHAKYVVEKCRCEPCTKATRDYERRRVHAINRPDETWVPYVPAGPARRHVRDLMAMGIGPKSIAKLSGVPHGAISKLIYGNYKGRRASRRIRPETARRLLAVTPEMASGAQKVDASPTWALLDDLIDKGWTRAELARRLGQKGPGLQVRRTKVRASTARTVERLHAELASMAPPPKRSRWWSQ